MTSFMYSLSLSARTEMPRGACSSEVAVSSQGRDQSLPHLSPYASFLIVVYFLSISSDGESSIYGAFYG